MWVHQVEANTDSGLVRMEFVEGLSLCGSRAQCGQKKALAGKARSDPMAMEFAQGPFSQLRAQQKTAEARGKDSILSRGYRCLQKENCGCSWGWRRVTEMGIGPPYNDECCVEELGRDTAATSSGRVLTTQSRSEARVRLEVARQKVKG